MRYFFKALICLLAGILVYNSVHELVHFYRFRKLGLPVSEICLLGMMNEEGDDIWNKTTGWVSGYTTRDLTEYEESYKHNESTPRLIGTIASLLSTILILFITDKK